MGVFSAIVLTVVGPVVAQNSPTELIVIPTGPFLLEPGIEVRLDLPDGRRVEGEAASWSSEGFQGPFGVVSWRSVQPTERFRLRRQFMRQSGQDTLEGWASLAVGLLLINDSDRLSRQALSRVKALAGRERAEAVLKQIQMQVETLRKEWDAQEEFRATQQLQSGPPHIKGYSSNTWPIRDPDLQKAEAERVRTRVEKIVSGLPLNPAQSASVIAFGAGETSDVALVALRLDQLHGNLAGFLDASSKVNVFPGVAALIMVPQEDQLRLIAAEQFQHSITGDVDGALFFDGETPIIVLHEKDNDLENSLNRARLFTLAFLHGHISAQGLPPWIEVGLSEYFAHNNVKGSMIDQQRRYRALDVMRAGKHPGWILQVKADDPHLWPDGPARDLAYLLVTRMIEDNPEGMRRLIAALKGGATLQEAFPRFFRISPGSYMNDSARWFQFND